MLGLLALCPHEVAHLRKELLIAAKHILATDQRNRFVPHMERLFDENILIGSGWTTQVRSVCVQDIRSSAFLHASRVFRFIVRYFPPHS